MYNSLSAKMGVKRDLKEAYKTKWDIGRVSTGQREGLLKLGFGNEAVHLGHSWWHCFRRQ